MPAQGRFIDHANKMPVRQIAGDKFHQFPTRVVRLGLFSLWFCQRHEQLTRCHGELDGHEHSQFGKAGGGFDHTRSCSLLVLIRQGGLLGRRYAAFQRDCVESILYIHV